MNQSIKGPLQNWTKGEWTRMSKCITKLDGSKFGNGADLKEMFIELLSDGWHCTPVGECDNFDKVKGCLGHE